MSKIIHQIAISESSLSGYVPPNKTHIDTFFNNYQYIFWDYKKIKNFILKNGDRDVLEAIDNISANAFKADIARYYIVYNLGGWYSDLNNFFLSEPPKNNNELIFFRDFQFMTGTSWAVQNSLFYAEKRHKVLELAISSCIENVKRKYYGGHPLCPTSPNLFGSVIASINLPENHRYMIGEMGVVNGVTGFYLENECFATYKTNGLKAAESGIPGGNNYETIWHSRELYQ